MNFTICNIPACLIFIFWLCYQNLLISKTQKRRKILEKEITLHFDLDDEMENRVYSFLKNMSEVYNEPNLSKAIILFISNMASTFGECEEWTARCETVLKGIVEQGDKWKIGWLNSPIQTSSICVSPSSNHLHLFSSTLA